MAPHDYRWVETFLVLAQKDILINVSASPNESILFQLLYSKFKAALSPFFLSPFFKAIKSICANFFAQTELLHA